MAGIVTIEAGQAIDALLKAPGVIRSAITGEMSPELRASLEQAAIAAEQARDTAQAAINQVEAASPKLFIAGWRPYIGWVCGAGVTLQFFIRPVLMWVFAILKLDIALPELDVGSLYSLTLALLGMSGLRTYEKKAGIADKH